MGGHRGVRPAGVHLARGQRLWRQQEAVPGVREGADGGALEERAAVLPVAGGGAAEAVRAGQGQAGVRQAQGEGSGELPVVCCTEFASCTRVPVYLVVGRELLSALFLDGCLCCW